MCPRRAQVRRSQSIFIVGARVPFWSHAAPRRGAARCRAPLCRVHDACRPVRTRRGGAPGDIRVVRGEGRGGASAWLRRRETSTSHRSRTRTAHRRRLPGTHDGAPPREGPEPPVVSGGRLRGGAGIGRGKRRRQTTAPPDADEPPSPRRRPGTVGVDPAVRSLPAPWIPARSSGPRSPWCRRVPPQQAGKGPPLVGLWSIKSGSVTDAGSRGRTGARPAGPAPAIEHVWLHSPDCRRELQALP